MDCQSAGIEIGSSVAHIHWANLKGEVMKTTGKSFTVKWNDGKEKRYLLKGENPTALKLFRFTPPLLSKTDATLDQFAVGDRQIQEMAERGISEDELAEFLERQRNNRAGCAD